MNNYIVALYPWMDPIKMYYPVSEGIVPSSEELEKQKFFVNEILYGDEETDEKETDPIIAAWLHEGLGRISLGKDGELYVKITAKEIKNAVESTFNLVQDLVKLCSLSNFVTPEFRFTLSNIINGETDLKIVNCAESSDVLSKNQWLYSEYNRILNDPVYKDKDLDSITIIYKVCRVIKYDKVKLL